jgi:TonB family protein
LKFLALSLAVHIIVSTVAFYSARKTSVAIVHPQEIKYYPVHLYLPGGMSGKQTPQPPGRKKDPSVHHAATSNLAVNAHPAPAAGAPPAVAYESLPGNGTDAESENPAFPVFSPRPPVSDRSLLPGSDRQVVVDVKVSAIGEVLEATLVKGIGNGLDQIVLDTVKTWRFHPATINGNPVPTEAELIFPFNQSYPTSPS